MAGRRMQCIAALIAAGLVAALVLVHPLDFFSMAARNMQSLAGQLGLGQPKLSGPVDPELKTAGQDLYATLQKIMDSNAFVFGHHNSDLMGEHWADDKADRTKSDVVNATGGSFPGMVGYNLNWVAMGRAVDWEKHIAHMQKLGVLIHVYWEANNPTTCTMVNGAPEECKDAHDLSGDPIQEILPGHSANHVWTLWMDRVADFLHMCGQHGVAVVFRPFHENTGDWFWWGTKAATAQQYLAAWKYTQEYLMKRKGVHNALYAYAPSKPSDQWSVAYTERYPGDNHVDIVCFDRYGVGDDFRKGVTADCSKVVDFATGHGKLPAICEFGVAGGSQNSKESAWFMTKFLNPVMAIPKCRRITFAYTWANRAPGYYFVPLPGQDLFPGFKEFFHSNHTIFGGHPLLTAVARTKGNSSVLYV